MRSFTFELTPNFKYLDNESESPEDIIDETLFTFMYDEMTKQTCEAIIKFICKMSYKEKEIFATMIANDDVPDILRVGSSYAITLLMSGALKQLQIGV